MTIGVLENLDAGLGDFDTVIDVRSPAEFAEDHVPAAINLPVLSDGERAEVGTIYVQRSKFEARRLGAALIARNVAAHLEQALRDKPGGWRPLVYCWRGGQRSHGMALILAEVGWRTTVVAGGYRTYRRSVVARLYGGQATPRVVLLGGPTGVGKTEVLARLPARGVQTLDLEALANHRGSLFGEMGEQPSQKLFESRLAAALAALDPARPVVVEAESSRIGERFLPSGLWGAMRAADRIELLAPAQDRARALLHTYRALAQDGERLRRLLHRLPGRHGHARLEAWVASAEAGQLQALAESLVEHHYDPAYARSRKGSETAATPIPVRGVDAAGWDQAADAVAALIARVA